MTALKKILSWSYEPSILRADNENPVSPSLDRRPLRIALFSGNYDCVRDGANQALNRLVGHLIDRAGASVRVYTPVAARPAFASVGNIRPVRSVGIPGRPEYRIALGLTRAAKRDLQDFAPDLIHLSAPDLLGRQAQKYALAKGIPVVTSLHTRFETYLDYYRLSALRRPVERYLDRFYADSSHILAPTAPIAASMAARHGAGKVSIWGRGVDRRLFHPAKRDEGYRQSLGYGPEDVAPLFFGRLVLEKGLDIFIDTIAALRRSGYHVRPMIIGEGPARNAFAARLDNANFLGHLEGEALGRAVASADILINPSVTEAFGNVNLEAMASGLAVVSADVASASALIDHGRTGLLVEPRDVGAYAKTADRLIRDKAARAALGRAASLTAEAYLWEEILGGVHACYRACLDEFDAPLPLLGIK
ncbi:glycosyltransferase family 1 protein [Sphingobium aromaticiconvertens]|uniref:glycosyltransferase family 4 protein n=1 Tax=Sphingobium aromaticiconvertens TaxID=365341 RepID=UPI003019A649